MADDPNALRRLLGERMAGMFPVAPQARSMIDARRDRLRREVDMARASGTAEDVARAENRLARFERLAGSPQLAAAYREMVGARPQVGMEDDAQWEAFLDARMTAAETVAAQQMEGAAADTGGMSEEEDDEESGISDEEEEQGGRASGSRSSPPAAPASESPIQRAMRLLCAGDETTLPRLVALAIRAGHSPAEVQGLSKAELCKLLGMRDAGLPGRSAFVQDMRLMGVGPAIEAISEFGSGGSFWMVREGPRPGRREAEILRAELPVSVEQDEAPRALASEIVRLPPAGGDGVGDGRPRYFSSLLDGDVLRVETDARGRTTAVPFHEGRMGPSSLVLYEPEGPNLAAGPRTEGAIRARVQCLFAGLVPRGGAAGSATRVAVLSDATSEDTTQVVVSVTTEVGGAPTSFAQFVLRPEPRFMLPDHSFDPRGEHPRSPVTAQLYAGEGQDAAALLVIRLADCPEERGEGEELGWRDHVITVRISHGAPPRLEEGLTHMTAQSVGNDPDEERADLAVLVRAPLPGQRRLRLFQFEDEWASSATDVGAPSSTARIAFATPPTTDYAPVLLGPHQPMNPAADPPTNPVGGDLVLLEPGQALRAPWSRVRLHLLSHRASVPLPGPVAPIRLSAVSSAAVVDPARVNPDTDRYLVVVALQEGNRARDAVNFSNVTYQAYVVARDAATLDPVVLAFARFTSPPTDNMIASETFGVGFRPGTDLVAHAAAAQATMEGLTAAEQILESEESEQGEESEPTEQDEESGEAPAKRARVAFRRD